MIFYLHIPKTGGLTLGLRFASAFLPDQVHVLQNGLHFPKELETLRLLAQTKEFVESHVSGPLLSQFNDFDLMVTVRDPVERIISHWRHALRDHNLAMHRPANKLNYSVFFEIFGDYYVDHQSRYFTGAFTGIGEEIHRFGHYPALTKRLLELIDRVRWFVPTDKIDEFISLWSLETKRWVPNVTQRINVSEELPVQRSETIAEVQAYLRKRTDLYAVNSLFYNIACAKFAAYRANLVRSQGVERYADNSRRAFISGDSAIWLSDNWYDPVAIEEGYAWWAGPTVKSLVHVRRANNEKYLTFDVVMVSGIKYQNIVLFNNNMLKRLPTQRIQRGPHCRFCIALDGVDGEDDVVVIVPDCKAEIITTSNRDGLDRQSFAATNWSLSSHPIT